MAAPREALGRHSRNQPRPAHSRRSLVRRVLLQHGMHLSNRQVQALLELEGVSVSRDTIQQVRLALLKRQTGLGEYSKFGPPRVRPVRRPRKIP